MSKVTMWRSRWRCVIKPAYAFSFLLSINIFVWQNVLYFLDSPRILGVCLLLPFWSLLYCASFCVLHLMWPSFKVFAVCGLSGSLLHQQIQFYMVLYFICITNIHGGLGHLAHTVVHFLSATLSHGTWLDPQDAYNWSVPQRLFHVTSCYVGQSSFAL